MAFKTMIVDEGRTDALAWKCATEDFEFGARLNVHESQLAVFFRDGQAVEALGPGMHVLETRNFPFLRFFTKLKFGKYFHCEVYFVNLSVQMSVPWGTRERVSMMLEVEPGKAMPLSVGASGTMNVQPDPQQAKEMLTWLLGTGRELTAEGMRDKFNSMLNTKIKTFMARVIEQQRMNAFTLDRHLNDISTALHAVLQPEFLQYGVLLREFYVDAFALPEDNPAFQEARLLAEGRYIQHGKLDLEYELRMKQAEKEAQLAQLEGQKTLVEADVAAKANVMTAQGEAARRSLEGITSVQEHQFETLNKMVEAGAGGSGMTPAPDAGGNGGGMGDMTGFFGDVMKMGIGMEMMKSMGDVMKDAMNSGSQAGMNLAGTMQLNPQAAQNQGGMPVQNMPDQGGMNMPGMNGMPRQNVPYMGNMAMPGVNGMPMPNVPYMGNMAMPGVNGMPMPNVPYMGNIAMPGVNGMPMPNVPYTGNMNAYGMNGMPMQNMPENASPDVAVWKCGCGRENRADDRFCGGCGKKRGED